MLDDTIDCHPCIGKGVSVFALGTATTNASGKFALPVRANARDIIARNYAAAAVGWFVYLFFNMMSVFCQPRLVGDERDKFRKNMRGC